MNATTGRPWWLENRTLIAGTGAAALVCAWKIRQQPWAPLYAELEIWRIIFRDGWHRVFVPSNDDGTCDLTFRQRVNRVGELRAILGIERNHQIDLAKNGPPGQGWSETAGVNHMRHLPGLVFRGDDTKRAAESLAKQLSLPDVKRQATLLMREKMDVPVMKDLVLVGGGHSHVHVLRMLGMEPQPGVRVTLITRDVETPYSGMLPGHVAGLYTREECHIDLNVIARFAHVRLVHATVTGLDLTNKRVILSGDRPPIGYDILSINIGSAPRVQSSDNTENVTPVKPIDGFGARWDTVLAGVPSWQGEQRVVVVGGGAGGIELALAVKARLGKELEKIGSTVKLSVSLVTRRGILPQHTPGVRSLVEKAMRERGIECHSGCDVTGTHGGLVNCADGRSFPFNQCIWCTEGSPQAWVGDCGLAVDSRGFLSVDQRLQCHAQHGVDCGSVFAGGDIASVAGFDRPKSGVFAVMGGFVLWLNIRATLYGEEMFTYWPQSSFLSLLGLGDGNCIASRGTLATEGKWLWELKDWIDRKWMWDQSGGLPEMPEPDFAHSAGGAIAAAAGENALSLLSHSTMRCGGCGAKVGATTLSRAMARVDIPAQPGPDAEAKVVVGVGDDAAVVAQKAEGKNGGELASVQTIDFFRSFIEDPYVFGRIATVHALSDCEAMGAIPQTALALVQMPHAMEEKTEEDLVQLMSGAAAALKDAGCALVGGHTCEAKELGLGMAVVGRMPGGVAAVLRKDALRQGDALILTKPIGTGTLFAADMRAKARGPWVMAALRSMQTSNGPSASILRKHGTMACTDITGFGLVGHLLEMCRGSKSFVSIDLQKIPLYAGAMECLAMGITSSLQPANVRMRRAVDNHNEVCDHSAYPLLFDPQTSGGLVGALPMANAEACVKELRESGAAPYATIIGEVSGAAPENAAPDWGHIRVRVA